MGVSMLFAIVNSKDYVRPSIFFGEIVYPYLKLIKILFKVWALTDLSLWTSLRKKEQANSKKLFPNDVTPHCPIKSQRFVSLSIMFTTVNGVDFLDQITLLWRWCLQTWTHKLYSSFGMVIASPSPLRQGTNIELQVYQKHCYRRSMQNKKSTLWVNFFTFVIGMGLWHVSGNMVNFHNEREREKNNGGRERGSREKSPPVGKLVVIDSRFSIYFILLLISFYFNFLSYYSC